jgi:hypothetical protein
MSGKLIKRRKFLAAIGATAGRSLAVRAQPAAVLRIPADLQRARR